MTQLEMDVEFGQSSHKSALTCQIHLSVFLSIFACSLINQFPYFLLLVFYKIDLHDKKRYQFTHAHLRIISFFKNYFLYKVSNVIFSFFFFSSLLFYLFIFGCVGSLLHAGFLLVAASGGCSSLRCMGFSLWWLLLWSTGSSHRGFSSCGTQAQQLWLAGSVVVVHGLCCSEVCGIFPNQGSNPCPLHWQADS